MTDQSQGDLVETPEQALAPENETTVTSGRGTPAVSIPDLFASYGSPLLRGDIALALGVVLILVVLILPMPRWLLDFSLALSMTFSVLILMNVLFIIL